MQSAGLVWPKINEAEVWGGWGRLRLACRKAVKYGTP